MNAFEDFADIVRPPSQGYRAALTEIDARLIHEVLTEKIHSLRDILITGKGGKARAGSANIAGKIEALQVSRNKIYMTAPHLFPGCSVESFRVPRGKEKDVVKALREMTDFIGDCFNEGGVNSEKLRQLYADGADALSRYRA